MHGELQIATGLTRSFTLRDLAAVFFRRARVFVLTFSVVLVLGLLYAFLANSYIAQMKLLVRRGRIDPAVSPTQTSAPQWQSAISEEELNSAAELLHDEGLLRDVVARTGLAEQHSWLSWLRGGTSQQNIEQATVKLSKALKVQPVRKSQVITVSYGSSDPLLAAAVLKNLGDAYLARQAQMQRPSGQLSFFEEQVQIAKKELQRAQHEYANFTRRERVVSAALERDLTLQKLSDAQASDFALQASLAEAYGRSQSLDEKLQQLPPRRITQVRNSDNPQLQENLKSKLLELELRRTQLLTRFQSSYRLVQEVDQQIAQTKMMLEAENLAPLRDEITEDNPDFAWANSERMKAGVEIQALRGRAAATRQQLASYQAKAQELSRNALEQRSLEQNLKSAEDRYLLYAGKREESRIGDALDQASILNVAIAQPPSLPVLPSTPLWIAACLSFFGASVASTGVVFVADYFDRSLRTSSEVTALLGIPVLASLPAKDNAGHLEVL